MSKKIKHNNNLNLNRRFIKLKGSGLPTLLTPKCFSFDERADPPQEFKNILNDEIAVKIILKILNIKLSGKGVLNRFYLLNARTGSGKSTTFINNLYDEFIRGNNCKIFVTEPRVPLCSANASEIVRWTKFPSDEMGKNIGYLTGPSKVRCDSTSGILYYSTPQILANQLNNLILQNNIKSSGYIKIVVIDEAHLLDMPTLQTLNVVFNVLEKYGDNELCPLFIFTSATLNIDPFINYYCKLSNIPTGTKPEDIYKNYLMIGYVSGSANFDVNLSYMTEKENNLLLKSCSEAKDPIPPYSKVLASDIVKNLLCKMLDSIPTGEHGNDLLIFVPKMSIASNISTYLEETINETDYNGDKLPVHKVIKGEKFNEVENWRNQNRNKKRVLILPFGRGFSFAGDELLKTATEPDPDAKVWERKIIISTPIIEAGKTIASLRYVYDLGLELKPSFKPLTHNPYARDNLKVFPINQSSAIQRLGRVGREQTGNCLRLYTKETYDMLNVAESPETINNYCLSRVLISQIQAVKKYTYYDIINNNNYLFKISVDIQLRSICDLINSGFISLFGNITDTIMPLENMDPLVAYIQQLYYIKGYSLFDALLIINLNFKTISAELTPKPLPKLQYDIDNLDNIKPEGEIIDAIKKSRNIITLVLYDQTYTTFKYLYKRLFDKIEITNNDKELNNFI